MSSKKKLITAITSLAVVAVIAVVAVTVTLAALQATVTSGFQISYTAKNVTAEVTGQYFGGTTASFTDMTATEGQGTGNKLEFNQASDPNESVEKGFKTIEGLQFTSQNKAIYFVYKFTNLDTTNGLDVKFTVTATDSNGNIKLYYDTSTEELSTTEAVEALGFETELTSGQEIERAVTVAKQGEESQNTTYIVIKVEMQSVTTNVNLTNGSIKFDLNPGAAA